MKDTGYKLCEALRALDAMEKAQGSNEKKAILKQYEKNDVLRDLCFAAYGGDKFNAYPTLQFKDSTASYPPFKEEDEAIIRYDFFKVLLVDLRDRKLSGDAAVEALNKFLSECGTIEKKWYRRVLEHDLKIGMHTSFSKLWDFKQLTLEGTPKTGKVRFPGTMLCEKNEKFIEKWKTNFILVEPKYDGLRLMFVLEESGDWSFFSRGGKNDRYNDNLGHIAADLIDAMKCEGYTHGCIDGEILGATWNATLAVKRKEITEADYKEIQLCNFYAFDHLNGWDDKRDQIERRTSLVQICARAKEIRATTHVVLTPQHRVANLAEAKKLFAKFLIQGFEGAVVKSPFAVYQLNNKRTKEWVKIKAVDTMDVRVIGRFQGKERTKYESMLGGFHVIDGAGQEFNVGGGFTDAQRAEYWTKPETEFVGRWMEIEFQRDTQQVAKARFPVFIRWRDDLS